MTGGDPRRVRTAPVPGAGVLGMGIFLATLGMLFAAAIVGFLVVRLRAPSWPAIAHRSSWGLAAATLVLLAASVTISGAKRAIRRGLAGLCARRMGATLALGFLFLAVQGWNWRALLRQDVTAASGLAAFTFFMLTGLHAAHVIGGVALLLVVWLRARAGRYDAAHHPGVTYSAMYWHFLDVVWLALLIVLLVAT